MDGRGNEGGETSRKKERKMGRILSILGREKRHDLEPIAKKEEDLVEGGRKSPQNMELFHAFAD